MPNGFSGFVHVIERFAAFLSLDHIARHIWQVSDGVSWTFLPACALYWLAFRYVLGPALRVDWETLTDISEVRR